MSSSPWSLHSFRKNPSHQAFHFAPTSAAGMEHVPVPWYGSCRPLRKPASRWVLGKKKYRIFVRPLNKRIRQHYSFCPITAAAMAFIQEFLAGAGVLHKLLFSREEFGIRIKVSNFIALSRMDFLGHDILPQECFQTGGCSFSLSKIYLCWGLFIFRDFYLHKQLQTPIKNPVVYVDNCPNYTLRLICI